MKIGEVYTNKENLACIYNGYIDNVAVHLFDMEGNFIKDVVVPTDVFGYIFNKKAYNKKVMDHFFENSPKFNYTFNYKSFLNENVKKQSKASLLKPILQNKAVIEEWKTIALSYGYELHFVKEIQNSQEVMAVNDISNRDILFNKKYLKDLSTLGFIFVMLHELVHGMDAELGVYSKFYDVIYEIFEKGMNYDSDYFKRLRLKVERHTDRKAFKLLRHFYKNVPEEFLNFLSRY